jgi:hypothetical protein
MSHDGNKPTEADGEHQYDFNAIITSIFREVLSELWLANARGQHPCIWPSGASVDASLRLTEKGQIETEIGDSDRGTPEE